MANSIASQLRQDALKVLLTPVEVLQLFQGIIYSSIIKLIKSLYFLHIEVDKQIELGIEDISVKVLYLNK